jgi:hypothetical protein
MFAFIVCFVLPVACVCRFVCVLNQMLVSMHMLACLKSGGDSGVSARACRQAFAGSYMCRCLLLALIHCVRCSDRSLWLTHGVCLEPDACQHTHADAPVFWFRLGCFSRCMRPSVCKNKFEKWSHLE